MRNIRLLSWRTGPVCVSDNVEISEALSGGQGGQLWLEASQPMRPQEDDCRVLTWVFHLVMVQEAQSLQGIALGLPLQQP